jgi:hypothetical protein
MYLVYWGRFKNSNRYSVINLNKLIYNRLTFLVNHHFLSIIFPDNFLSSSSEEIFLNYSSILIEKIVAMIKGSRTNLKQIKILCSNKRNVF